MDQASRGCGSKQAYGRLARSAELGIGELALAEVSKQGHRALLPLGIAVQVNYTFDGCADGCQNAPSDLG